MTQNVIGLPNELIIYGPSPVTVTTNKTLAFSDANTIQNCTSAATVEIPPNSSVSFSIGTTIALFRNTSGVVAFSAGSGVTFLEPFSQYKVASQNGIIYAYQIAADTWIITGVTAP